MHTKRDNNGIHIKFLHCCEERKYRKKAGYSFNESKKRTKMMPVNIEI